MLGDAGMKSSCKATRWGLLISEMTYFVSRELEKDVKSYSLAHSLVGDWL